MYIHDDFLLFHHLLGERHSDDLTKLLDSPWADCSKASLNFTNILLTTVWKWFDEFFLFVCKPRQRMTTVWKSEKIWWDFLTRLEQIALRFPWISPAFFWQQSYVLKKHIYFLSFYVPTTTYIVSFNLETICWYIHTAY